MVTDVYWIDTPEAGRLAILARPRGGDWLADEVAGWRRAGIDRVVSLLEPAEAAELDLCGEADECTAAGIGFDSLPIPDRGVPPDRPTACELVESLADDLTVGRSVGIHCRQGIGRAAMVAAATLVACGLDPDDAFQRVAAGRGRDVPETPAQRDWFFALEHPSESAAR